MNTSTSVTYVQYKSQLCGGYFSQMLILPFVDDRPRDLDNED